MWEVYNDLARLVRRMGPEEYFLLVAMAVIVGFFCLRGIGSRSRY